MASTTYSNFGAETEGIEVTKAFANIVRGKTIFITGVAPKSLGQSAAIALAPQGPARFIFAGRTISKLQDSIDFLKKDYPDIDYRTLQVDLSSQKSVRVAADEVLSWSDVPSIDIVLNSAGVMGIPERTLSVDGIEMHFGTNHIGHFLLTSLIMPKIIKAAEKNRRGETRIVNVSARAASHSSMRWSDINFETLNKDLPEAEKINVPIFEAWGYKGADEVAYNPLDSYMRSKIANVLYGVGANARLWDKYGIYSTSMHPGVIATELGRHFPQEIKDAVGKLMGKIYTKKSFEAGSSTALVAALDPKLAVGVNQPKGDSENFGAYLDDCQVSDKASKYAVSSEEAEKLWKLSEKLVGQNFAW